MDLLKHPDVVPCEFQKGEYIIRQGENVEYLYLLVSGACHRTNVTEKGDEIIFGIKKPSRILIQSLVGVLVIYTDGISSNNFKAASKCRCYRIPKQTFLDYVQDKADILNQLICYAMYEFRELASSFQARQEGKVANRLCELLLKNAQEIQGELWVSKDFSNLTEISRFLGVHRVTVARIIKILKEEGVISKEDHCIVILNEKKLKCYAKAEIFIQY